MKIPDDAFLVMLVFAAVWALERGLNRIAVKLDQIIALLGRYQSK